MINIYTLAHPDTGQIRYIGKSKNPTYSYVESGKKEVVGSSGFGGGMASPIEEANVRQIYTQTPQAHTILR
jgi:hypothetical protein